VRYWWAPFVAVVLVAVILGVWGPSGLPDTGYLLTVVAAIALAGLGFALYGWFAAKELPELIERVVEERLARIEKELRGLTYRQQEAMQKIVASYAVDDTDRKIALLKQAVDIQPDAYNAYVALGYAFWEKGDLLQAQECFMKDLESHPDNHQAASDLAALYCEQEEWVSALHWLKRALRMNPSCWRDFESDTRFDKLRQDAPEPHSDTYRRLIEDARRREATPGPKA